MAKEDKHQVQTSDAPVTAEHDQKVNVEKVMGRGTDVMIRYFLGRLSTFAKKSGAINWLRQKGFDPGKMPMGFEMLRGLSAAMREFTDDIKNKQWKATANTLVEELSQILELLAMDDGKTPTTGATVVPATAVEPSKKSGFDNYMYFLMQLPPDSLKAFLEAIDGFDREAVTLREKIGLMTPKQMEIIVKKLGSSVDPKYWTDLVKTVQQSYLQDRIKQDETGVEQSILALEPEDQKKAINFLQACMHESRAYFDHALTRLKSYTVAEWHQFLELSTDNDRATLLGIKLDGDKISNSVAELEKFRLWFSGCWHHLAEVLATLKSNEIPHVQEAISLLDKKDREYQDRIARASFQIMWLKRIGIPIAVVLLFISTTVPTMGRIGWIATIGFGLIALVITIIVAGMRWSTNYVSPAQVQEQDVKRSEGNV